MDEHERTIAMLRACGRGQSDEPHLDTLIDRALTTLAADARQAELERMLDRAEACPCADCRRALLTALGHAIGLMTP